MMAAAVSLESVRAEASLELIRRCIAQEVAYIAPKFGNVRMDALRNTMRVEITRDALETLHKTAPIRDQYMAERGNASLRFDGVEFYVVERIPEPGWRLISPLSERRW